METPRERQESEVEALSAIYDRDFTDLREADVWKVSRPPEFTLRLGPNHDSQGVLEEHCHVLLRVKLSEEYPQEPPAAVKVQESRGLSDDLVQVLELELSELARRSVGEVMVTVLAQHAASWLSQHNRPAFGSFYEEMEAEQRERERRRQAEVEREREVNLAVERREQEAVREEVARRMEHMQEERQRLREESRRRNRGPSEGEDISPEKEVAEEEAAAILPALRPRSHSRKLARSTSTSMSESSDPGPPSSSSLKAAEELNLTWKGEKLRVEKLARIGGNVHGGSVFAGMMLPGHKMVAVAEWNFRVRGGGKKERKSTGGGGGAVHDEATLTKQLASVEQEMASLQRASSLHPGVVPYLGMSSSKVSPALVRVVLLEELVLGASLSIFLSENLPMEPGLLRFAAEGVLAALSHMHGMNVVHRDLRDSAVFLDAQRRVRVSGFSIDRRVRDLIVQGDEESERFPTALGRGAKKVDVFRMGLLVLSLASGEVVQEPKVPRGMDAALSDFLKKCLCRDERDRWSAMQLLEHSWLKEKVERPLERLQKKGVDGDGTSPEPEDEEEGDKGPVPVPFMQVGSGQSRLQSEFAFISKIGKGGFGEVMKVKNILDGQVYAIKKIRLSQARSRASATKKLMREVKLLSRLNHENVVRYYTSWIEVTTITEDKEETETSMESESVTSAASAIKKPTKASSPPGPKKKSLLDDLNLRLDGSFLNPGTGKEQDVSISFSSLYPEEADMGSSDEDEGDDDDDDAFGTSFLPQSDDGGWGDEEESASGIVFESSETGDGDSSRIAFEEDTEGREEEEVSEFAAPSAGSPSKRSESSSRQKGNSTAASVEIQVMYIQMEYCDKQTLRSAIDSGLYKDSQRVWRMFREIIEGLVHIHTQGMIHRDLKPVNIFLDSGDHVKIGDFGLATTNLITGGEVPPSANVTLDESSMDHDMTGQIGTALYIAPELGAGKSISYSQKVDLYSLGVIFFEMCYPPLTTGMERIKILSDLRSAEVKLPKDFDESLLVQQAYIIRWLLSHDPSSRPNSQELLSSDYLPPPQVEEAELRELVRHTLANSKSPAYRHLVDACLGQTMSLAQDITYDIENLRDLTRSTGGKSKSARRTLLAHEYVRRVAEGVFQRHGAVNVQLGHLLPRGKDPLYDSSRSTTRSVVEVMTRGGKVVGLPYDLRVTFARFLARSRISSLKRYCIAPVFREFQIFGYHPREQVECAFDVVTPTATPAADAEALFVADEILTELPAFRDAAGGRCFFRLNHVFLLRGILSNCGVAEEHHRAVYSVMRESAGWTKAQRATHLVNLGIPERTALSCLNVLEHEGTLSKVGGILRHLTRKKNSASADMKLALVELEAVVERAKAMGARCPMVISPSLVYNPGHFSGLVFQLVRKKKKGGGAGHEVLAAGGRYDRLLDSFAANISLCSGGGGQVSSSHSGGSTASAVGISLAMDRLVAAVSGELEGNFGGADVLLHSEPSSTSEGWSRRAAREEMELAGRLWSAGIKCLLCGGGQNMDDVQEAAKDLSARFIVVLRDGESGGGVTARIRSLEKDRFQEKKVALSEVPEFLSKQLLRTAGGWTTGDGAEHSGAGIEAMDAFSLGGSGQGTSISSSGLGGGGGGTGGPGGGSSGGGGGGSSSGSSGLAHVNYCFRYLDKSKYSAAARKRLESTISAKITPLLSLVSPGTVLEALALQLPRAVVSAAAGLLELKEDEAAYSRSVRSLLERHPRHRKELAAVCEEVGELKFDRGRSVFVLYSAEDHCYATLMAP